MSFYVLGTDGQIKTTPPIIIGGPPFGILEDNINEENWPIFINSTASILIANGTPQIVASVFEKAETGTDANVLTYPTNVTNDEFLVVYVATDVSALTGTSVVVTITWKDSNNATQTSNVTLSGVADGTINIPVNAFKNTNIVVSTVFTGVSTTYNISAFITRLR